MSPEAQRIAIAEACGWTHIIFRGIHEPQAKDYVGQHESCRPTGSSGKWQGPIPDYLNDLNACHDMEKMIEPGLMSIFVHNLYLAMGQTEEVRIGTAHTTAGQRCEAFLRTIGKWEEPK